ncbi:MAG: hypothetical protein ACTSWC_12260 [Promethearchaeota archaeon]
MTKRLNYIDKFRGLIILFTVFALNLSYFRESISSPRESIGPSWLIHGYQIYPFHINPIITFADLGLPIFIFIMGYLIPLKVQKIKLMKGTNINSIIIKAVILIGIDFLFSIHKEIFIFINLSLSLLSITYIIGIIIWYSKLSENEIRTHYISFSLIIASIVLNAFPGLRNLQNSLLHYEGGPLFPTQYLDAIAICLEGVYFYHIIEKSEGNISKEIKIISIIFIFGVILNFLFPPNRLTLNPSIVLIGYVFAVIFLLFFIKLDEYNVRWKFIESLGANSLTTFIVALLETLFLYKVLKLDEIQFDNWYIKSVFVLILILIQIFIIQIICNIKTIIKRNKIKWHYYHIHFVPITGKKRNGF